MTLINIVDHKKQRREQIKKSLKQYDKNKLFNIIIALIIEKESLIESMNNLQHELYLLTYKDDMNQ